MCGNGLVRWVMEWLMLLVVVVIYGGWFVFIVFYVVFFLFVLVLCGGWLIVWYGLLQYEMIYGYLIGICQVDYVIGLVLLVLWLFYWFYCCSYFVYYGVYVIIDLLYDLELCYWVGDGGFAVWLQVMLVGQMVFGLLILVVWFLVGEGVCVIW